eukprot:9680275-Heterocapsa_arctica.AAC.1
MQSWMWTWRAVLYWSTYGRFFLSSMRLSMRMWARTVTMLSSPIAARAEPEGSDAVLEVSHVGGPVLLARVEIVGSLVRMETAAEPPRLPFAHRGAVDERDAFVCLASL